MRRASRTTVAVKILMAITGLFFVLFVLMHMYGNLKMFAGADAYNEYAEHLRVMFEPILPREGLLWILRVLLVAALLIHAGSAFHLWHRARRARGQDYVKRNTLATSYAVRTMRWGGVILLAFIVFHILQFTTLTIEVGGDYHALTPYERMVVAFHNPFVLAFYTIAIGLLAMHVWHGAWSALATLGGNTARAQRGLKLLAGIIAAALFVGFMLPPFSIFLGLVS